MSGISRDRAYFDAIYADDPDPWRFRSSGYERAKYDVAIAAVADRHYSAGLEIGCSIGVLSARLAALCEIFLGLDISEHPLVAARAACADFPNAHFLRMKVPVEWPDGRFDLIILSEVLYFLSAADIAATSSRIGRCLLPGGRVLLVNWLGEPENPQPGDVAANYFIGCAGLQTEQQARHDLYRLDLLTAGPA
ncbi:MAG TPA: class I SAM-dependent methyltransferase [Acidisoma sp.]|jgi:SAM-dependent methyltransferase|nr:class I SAM-dependent methyltransferase [Acidisoma sp.]